MQQASQIHNPTSSNVTDRKSSVISSAPFIPPRNNFRFSKFYKQNVSATTSPASSLSSPMCDWSSEIGASMRHNASAVTESDPISPRISQSVTLLKCFSPQWLRRPKRRTTSSKCQSLKNDVTGDENCQQLAKMKQGSRQHLKMEQELRNEVAALENKLVYEQIVHEVLKFAHQQDPVFPISIPDFLPPKVKELLEEIIEVNDEIALLECQVCELKADLAFEQDAGKDLKAIIFMPHQSDEKNYPMFISDVNTRDAKKKGIDIVAGDSNNPGRFKSQHKRKIRIPASSNVGFLYKL